MNTRGRLLVVSSRAPFGNHEPYLRTELRELVRHFERVALVPVRTPDGELQDIPPEVEVLKWPLYSSEIARRAMWALLRNPERCEHVLVSLAFSREPGRLKNAAVALKALALADWIRQHHFNHVHAYWISTPATVAMIAARIAGIPWSATAHRWDIYERNAFDVKMRDAAFVRAISERGREDLHVAMPSLGSRILRIPIGADIPGLPGRPAANSGMFRIVCPAALVEIKGHAELLDAVKALTDRGVPVRCTFAGEGPLREWLARRIEELALQNTVDLAGFIPQNQLHAWYREGRFNAVVLASRHFRDGLMEGIPAALIEAMAFGVPVVATDSGSVPELVDESCGHLTPAGDAPALAAALADVYEHPQDALDRAKRAYERVSQRHNVRNQMREFAALIGGERILT